MIWTRYARHLDSEHCLFMFEDNTEYLGMEEVVYSWEMWTKDLSENPPSPDPRYYDSEKQCTISDFESQSEAESDSDEPPRLIPLPE